MREILPPEHYEYVKTLPFDAKLAYQSGKKDWKIFEGKVAQFVEKAAREEAEHRANHDGLTGLLNRSGLIASIESLIGKSKDIGVLMLDADKFKRINDKYGHSAGDKTLIDIASVLVETLRNTDVTGFTASRPGGDEFIAVIDLSPDPKRKDRGTEKTLDQRVTAVATRVQHAFDDYIELNTDLTGVNFGMSVGMAVWEPGMSAEELLTKADQQMYAKKHLRDAAQQTNLP